MPKPQSESVPLANSPRKKPLRGGIPEVPSGDKFFLEAFGPGFLKNLGKDLAAGEVNVAEGGLHEVDAVAVMPLRIRGVTRS